MAATSEEIEVSVVMPCLNEADTIGICVGKALEGLRLAGVCGEVVIADNGSSDGSPDLATQNGARVIHVAEKGYGSALIAGIEAARGKYVIMGDADDSYDFLEIPKFVEKLRGGAQLVQGCRLPAGGGKIKPGAMPFLHRWLGNPMFSFLVRLWFGAPIHDVYCGLRGFEKAFQQSLRQRCTGMEFAIEMIVKASVAKARIAEVPITLHQDGRRERGPHLRTFRDGWRTLRFLLMCSPRRVFTAPGFFLLGIGVCGGFLALTGTRIGPATFDAHTLLISGLCLMLGYQAIVFAVLAGNFAVSEGFMPQDPAMQKFFRWATLERGLMLGALACCLGVAVLAGATLGWKESGFGALDYSRTMRWVIPGATVTALGFQTILFSFLVSMTGIRRR